MERIHRKKLVFIIGIFILIASLVISVFVLIHPKTNDKKTETQNSATPNETQSKIPSTYDDLMKSFNENVPEFYYYYKDLDDNGVCELLILENCALYIYTYDDNGVRQIGSHDFVTGTLQFLESDNYSGIFVYTVGGGCDHYRYLTLCDDNISITKLCEYYYSADEPYWNDVSDDKEMVAEAKTLYENVITFTQYVPLDFQGNDSVSFINGANKYVAVVEFEELTAKNLKIYDDTTKELLQTIPLNRSEEVTTTDKNIYALDVNFDGYIDLLIPDMHPARAIFFNAYIYDSAQQKFVEAPSFKNLPNIALDAQNKQILYYSGGDNMFNYGMAFYDKDKKDFVTTNSILIKPNPTDGTTEFPEYHFEECRYEDGKKIIVNEFNIPLHEFYLYPVTYPDILPYYQEDSFWDLYSDKWDCLFKNENGVICINDDNMIRQNLSLQEVKTIFEPLLNKAIEVEQTIINDSATFKYEKEIAFKTDDGSDYSLITDDKFDSIDDVWYYAYTAFTDDAASRAFDKYLAQYEVSPRFLLRDGKLYYKVNGHGYKSDFDIDSLKIVNQFNNTIIVTLDNYSFDENTPDKCIFILQNTENGWRFANTEEESYTINADDFMAQVIATHTSQQPAINAFIDFLNAKTTAKNLTPNQPKLAKTNIYITDLNRRDLSLLGVDQYTFYDLNGDDIPELITEGYEIDVFSYSSDGNISWIYSSPAGSSSLKYLLANKKIYWSLASTGVSYEIASFDKNLNVTVDTYFDGATEAEDDDELYLHNGKKLTAKEFYKLKLEFFAPHFFESPDTVWYAYNTQNNSSSTSRDIGEMQPETQEIITISGKCYQSYVAPSVDIRYVWVSREEYEMSATWDWVPIGTKKFYSLLLLSKVNEGGK